MAESLMGEERSAYSVSSILQEGNYESATVRIRTYCWVITLLQIECMAG